MIKKKTSKIARAKVVTQRNKNGEIIHTQSTLNTIRWKTEVCNQGEQCWCRLIVPETPQKDNEGVEMYIVPSGTLPKVNAEHIVMCHNLILDISGMEMTKAKKVVKSKLKKK